MANVNILDQAGSAISSIMIQLRDQHLQKHKALFRQNLKKIGALMAYEMSKSFQYEKVNVKTALGAAQVWEIQEEIVLIAILRAAAPMCEGFAETLPKAEMGMIGAMRKGKEEIDIDLSYVAIPDINGKRVIIIDPMLATAKSMVKTVDTILASGTPSSIDIACLVSAPEGIMYLSENISTPYVLWTCAVDSHLNDHYYIIPGLGDAGDLAFGSKT
jgi:uracil phosphoribosyltransferase